MSIEPPHVALQTPSGYRMEEVGPSLLVGAETVRRLLPAFDQVSITVIDSGGSAVTCAQAGDIVGELDRLQYGLGEGPCIDSIRGNVRVVAPHIQRDQRWGRYAPAAAQHGLRAQLAAPLGRRGDGPMGALNMYSTTGGDIASTAPLIAHAFAAQVTGALESSREIENLHHALAARKTIGIALGMLMAQYQLSETAAFAVLKRHSSHTNTKIRDIAARMSAEGNAALVMPTAHVEGHHDPDTAAPDRSLPRRRKEAAVEATKAPRVAADQWFQLTFVAPNGRTYETTLQAPSDTEAVRLADETLHGVGRVRIRDSLHGDGLSVRPPARLHVERVPGHQAALGIGLVITDPNGTVTRRHLDQ